MEQMFCFLSEKNCLKCRVELKCLKKNLRNLFFKDGRMTESELEDFISMCPLLESLVLYKCTGLEKVRIQSPTLKSLVLYKCSKVVLVEVDAPNLQSYDYEGRAMSPPLINAPRLSEAKFYFSPYEERSIARVRNFFSNLDLPKGVKLINMYEEEYDF